MATPAESLSVEEIRMLLESDRLAAHRRAIGWIVSVPALSPAEAETLVSALTANLNRQDPFKKRIAMRGLRAVYTFRPDVVAVEIGSIVRGFEDYHSSVRRETIETTAAILADQPALAGSIYPLLESGTPVHRDMALAALVEAARSQPVVLRPVVPAIQREIERNELARDTLARAVQILAEADPHFEEGLVSGLIAWQPFDQSSVEAAVLETILARTDWSPTIRPELVHLVLDGLADAPGPDPVAAEWLVTTIERDAAIGSTVAEWAADRPRPECRRILARVDEATERVDPTLVAWLSLGDDPVVGSRFVD